MRLGTLSVGLTLLLWLSLVAPLFISAPVHGYASIGYSVSFDSAYYQLGASGSFSISVAFNGGSADIQSFGIYLYFVKADGTLYQSPLFQEYYGDNPIYAPANTTMTLSQNFTITTDQSLISGRFYYRILITSRAHGTLQYGDLESDISCAASDFNYCYLSNPLHQDYDSLQSQVNSLKSQASTLQSQISNLQSQVSDLQTNNTDLQSQTTSLNSQVNSLQSQLSNAQSQNFPTTVIAWLGMSLAVLFIGTTIYFAIRKQKVKTKAPLPLRT